MVGNRRTRTAAWLLAAALLTLSTAPAQNYSSSDTLTEYPNKGTYYHDRFEGRKTANGEIFDQNKFTAAHWKIKLGTYVMVTNRNNGMQVIVRVNDRCPKRGVFDLSHRAATAIGIKGMQPVNVRLLGDGWHERWLAQETQFDSVSSRLGGNRGQPPAPEPKEPAEAAPAGKPVPEATSATRHPHRDPLYNIVLGIAADHSNAFSMIQKLPEIYHDKVSVEPLEGDTTLRLTLEVNLQRDNAEELARALQHSFPQCKITPSE